MPTHPHQLMDTSPHLMSYDYHPKQSYGQSDDNNEEENAASILQSVKEQEAQFEQLTKELEAERASVATQLQRCKLGSETASMSSISSTDESFHWRPPASAMPLDEESDAESRMSGSQLVDSCLRVLQERGLMNVGEDPREYMPEDPRKPPVKNLHDELTVGQNHNNNSTVTTVTKVVTTREVHHGAQGSHSNFQGQPPSVHGPSDPHSYVNHSYQSDAQHQARNDANYSDDGVFRDPPTPSRFPIHPGLEQLNDMPDGHNGYDPSMDRGQGYDPSMDRGQGYDPSMDRGQGYDPSMERGRVYDPSMERGVMYSDNRNPNDSLPYDSFDRQYSHDSRDPAPPYDGRYQVSAEPTGRVDYRQYQPSPRPEDHYSDAGYAPSPRIQSPHDYSPRTHTPQQFGDDHPPVYSSHPSLGTPTVGTPTRPVGTPTLGTPTHPSYPGYGRFLSDLQDRSPSVQGSDYGRFPPRDTYGSGQVHAPSLGSHGTHPSTEGLYRPTVQDDGMSDRGSERNHYGSNGRLGNSSHPDLRYPAGPRSTDSPRSDRNSIYPPSAGAPLGGNPRLVDSPTEIYASKAPPNNSYPSDEDPYRLGAQGEDPYSRGPEADRLQQRTPSPNMDQSGQHPMGSLSQLPAGSYSNPMYADHPPGGPGDFPSQQPRDHLDAPPHFLMHPDDFDPTRRSPSIDSVTRDQRWRNPELPEVIDFLRHPNNNIKANAAAYLQHLCFMDDPMKSKTRSLGGIPALVELVNSEIPEVHMAACGALKNLSYGRANEENKKAIKNAGGIPALIRLLRKSTDNDVRELVTGILWNISSCKDLKKPIIDEGLTVIVGSVIVPHSGWDPEKTEQENPPRDVYWTTVFRNASGVLRNLCSDEGYARKKLRECDGLIDAVVYIVRAAIGKSDIDNKSVENCVCVLRNLSYACQEVDDPMYLNKRQQAQPEKHSSGATGCFGGQKKKKDSSKDQKNKPEAMVPSMRKPEPPYGMWLLWHPRIVQLYLPLLYDCTNPETLEAAAGALQNLAACEWAPSAEIRATVRKEKGLPVLVELLNLGADRVVCAAATALRNLAIDQPSKELIGKYAMRQLVTRLPQEGQPPEANVSMETICALEGLIYEVIKTSYEFALSLLNEGGLERLMYIVRNEKLAYKVRKYASWILRKMWEFKELHSQYKERGYREVNFTQRPVDPKRGSPVKSPPSSAENTLNRPRMDQSGPTMAGHSENTLPPITRHSAHNNVGNHTAGDSLQHTPREEVPMTVLGPSTRHFQDQPSPAASSRDDYFMQNNPPVGGYQDNRAPPSPLGYTQNPGPEPQAYAPRDYDQGSDFTHPVGYDRREGFDPRDAPSEHGDPRVEDYGQRAYPAEYHPGDLSHDQYEPRHDDYRPPGGVAFFPDHTPGSQMPQPQEVDGREPLYARVNKSKREPGGVEIEGLNSNGQGPGGADSWV